MSKPFLLRAASLLCAFPAILLAQNTPGAPLPSPDNGEPPAPARSSFDARILLGVAVPAAMIAYGAIAAQNDSPRSFDCKTRDRIVGGGRCIDSSADNFLVLAPAAAAFALKAAGLESKSTTTDMVVQFAASNLVQAGIVFGAKKISGRERPDGSDCNSFPSAHTAITFTAAEFLHQEYGGKSPWISVGGYTLAAAVGASRVYKNKHWVSDVVAGAGIGILSTKAVYWLYPSLKQKITSKKSKTQTLVLPDYSNGTANLKVVHQF